MSGCSRAADLASLLDALSPDDLAFVLNDWLVWARDDQLPPAAGAGAASKDWRVWLILGGRGAGKTRAGAEWVRAKALGLAPLAERPAERIALVGETIADVRRVMIEGVSGLLSVHSEDERPRFEVSKGQLVWPNGTVAEIFSAESPDGLRGPQFAAAWCDELCKWRHAEATWDMLQFALRLGLQPQAVVTTTPRPLPLLKAIMADGATVTTRAATADNADNLAPSFVAEMQRRYEGTALGRQELFGEVLEELSGGLCGRHMTIIRRTGWSQRSIRAVISWSRCCGRSTGRCPCVRCGRHAASGCGQSLSLRFMPKGALCMRAGSRRWKNRCARSGRTGGPAGAALTGSMRWCGRSPTC